SRGRPSSEADLYAESGQEREHRESAPDGHIAVELVEVDENVLPVVDVEDVQIRDDAPPREIHWAAEAQVQAVVVGIALRVAPTHDDAEAAGILRTAGPLPAAARAEGEPCLRTARVPPPAACRGCPCRSATAARPRCRPADPVARRR